MLPVARAARASDITPVQVNSVEQQDCKGYIAFVLHAGDANRAR